MASGVCGKPRSLFGCWDNQLPPRLTLQLGTHLPIRRAQTARRSVSSWAAECFSLVGGRAAAAALSPHSRAQAETRSEPLRRSALDIGRMSYCVDPKRREEWP